jgi:hypothetical protein
MNQTGIVAMIDEALERFAARELIASHEIVDFLLDMRIAALDDSELQQLLEAESQPTA